MLFSRGAALIYQQCCGAPFPPHPGQHLLLVFLLLAVLTSVQTAHGGYDLHFPDDK